MRCCLEELSRISSCIVIGFGTIIEFEVTCTGCGLLCVHHSMDLSPTYVPLHFCAAKSETLYSTFLLYIILLHSTPLYSTLSYTINLTFPHPTLPYSTLLPSLGQDYVFSVDNFLFVYLIVFFFLITFVYGILHRLCRSR